MKDLKSILPRRRAFPPRQPLPFSRLPPQPKHIFETTIYIKVSLHIPKS